MLGYYTFTPRLPLPNCPHCGVNRPSLSQQWNFKTADHAQTVLWNWAAYCCAECGGVILARSITTRGRLDGTTWHLDQNPIEYIYPSPKVIAIELPERVAHYLKQAIDTIHSPSASIIMSASAVDTMLKLKSYVDGDLNKRIKQAAEDHLITQDMAKWAHHIRLEANSQRHADIEDSMPNYEDARKCVEFAEALGEVLFVLPARVTRGLEASAPKGTSTAEGSAAA